MSTDINFSSTVSEICGLTANGTRREQIDAISPKPKENQTSILLIQFIFHFMLQLHSKISP